MAIGALSGTAPDEMIVGVSRYARLEGTDQAECAIVVADAWQGRGVGTELMRSLAQAARASGIRALVGSTSARTSGSTPGRGASASTCAPSPTRADTSTSPSTSARCLPDPARGVAPLPPGVEHQGRPVGRLATQLAFPRVELGHESHRERPAE